MMSTHLHLRWEKQPLFLPLNSKCINNFLCSRQVACTHAKSLQLYPTLCDPMNCSPPGFSVHRSLQATTLMGLPCPPPGGFPHPEMEPILGSGFLTTSTTWETHQDKLFLSKYNHWVYSGILLSHTYPATNTPEGEAFAPLSPENVPLLENCWRVAWLYSWACSF